LILINYINSQPDLALLAPLAAPPPYYDVSGGPNGEGDGRVTPLDVLGVINYLNSHPQATAGEGESVTTATATSASEMPVVLARCDLPALESRGMRTEPSASAPSVGQPDNGPPRVGSIPDIRTGSRPERGVLPRAGDHEEPLGLDTDLLELDSILPDIVLDIARVWNPSA